MITLDDLRIPMFAELPDEKLKKLRDVADAIDFEDGDIVYNAGEDAGIFYIVLSGEAVLEHELSKDVQVIFSSVEPGYCFGWTSLTRQQPRRATARSRGPSRMVRIQAVELQRIMEEDHTMGYILNHAFLEVVLGQLFTRTDQFMSMLSKHPDLKHAL
ncbi:MAG: cyclic nucleotide-binding domain-containing protein [Oceanidesulfovibrio sp.]